ncbi:hypothetical protein CsSME_00043342 [Camellia sinensis var. sinensis]
MAYNRLPSSGHNSPSSPPSSPLRSPRLRHSRSKGGRFSPAQPPRTVAQRLAGLLLSVLLRRQGIFLFAPLLYISGMLFYMGTVSFDVVPIINHRPAPGSVYRSPQLYAKLRPEMDADNSTSDAISTIWKRPKDYEWRACINKSTGGMSILNLPLWEAILIFLCFGLHLYLSFLLDYIYICHFFWISESPITSYFVY